MTHNAPRTTHLDASTVTTWGLAAYGLFVGAVAAWWLGHRNAGRQSFG